jgi:hypothetical protein
MTGELQHVLKVKLMRYMSDFVFIDDNLGFRL